MLFISWLVVQIKAHWQIAAAAAGLLLVLILVLVIAKCSKTPPKFTPIETVEADKAIEAKNRAAMVEVLVKSDAREAAAVETIVNAGAATINASKESREKWNNASDDEIRAELERRK